MHPADSNFPQGWRVVLYSTRSVAHVVVMGGWIESPSHECVEEKDGTSFGNGQLWFNRVRAGSDMPAVT